MSQAPPDHTPQSVASPWVDAPESASDSGMHAPEPHVDPGVRSASGRVYTILAVAVCVAALLGYVLEHRGLRSAKSTR
ncbi:MAG: hypothetical protein JXB13_01505, partial [Phycisphaerae bacterium]|nr:hypothetical protein [Phycisphaerae bacterium]